MSQFIGRAPGIVFNETIEEGVKAEALSKAIGIVGVAMKGPMKPTRLTSEQQLFTLFGQPNAVNSAVQGAAVCLRKSGEVWFQRVVSANASEATTWVEGSGEKPWAVFSTKDKTSLYNKYTVTLTWSNKGTEDAPDYQIMVVLKDNKGTILEKFSCSENQDNDLFIGRVVTMYSNYVNVVVSGEVASRSEVTYVLDGGDSGLDVEASDIIGSSNTGMKAFYDPEAIDIHTLVIPTWADKEVWEEGIRIGEYRKDVVFIPSLPVGLTPSEVANLVTGTSLNALQFDKTFVGLYWPNGLKKNGYTGGYDVVDIAPYIAAAFANTDSQSNVWTAPAGVKRGIIDGLDGLEYNTTKEERDMLYADEVNVNSVVNVRNYGFTIMGARTSKVYKITDGNTALRYINIRRLCNYFRKVVMRESLHNLFDQNDYYTWNDWKLRLDPYFREVKEGRGLYDYEIIMDETTVSADDIASGRMPGKIRIAPVKPNEFIDISFIVANDGSVTFSDEVVTE